MAVSNGKNSLKSTAILLVVLICGFAAVYFVSNVFEASAVKMPDHYSDNDLALQGKKLKGFVFGGEGLVADLYWMRSLQYIGDKIVKAPEGETINVENLTPYNPRLLYPLLDNATDLDPHFMTPYTYGSIVLPAIAPEQAITLAKKGIANNPKQWRLYQHLGYIYWRLKDYDKAAEVYREGAKIEGAPLFMSLMAGVMNTEGGSLETAHAIYSQLLAESTDNQSKELAQNKINEVESDIELKAINETLANIKERSGRCPASLAEITPTLAAVKLPLGIEFKVNSARELTDKNGVAYKFDAASCTAARGK